VDSSKTHETLKTVRVSPSGDAVTVDDANVKVVCIHK
jgi:alpha-D-xyloside xylohydrolase